MIALFWVYFVICIRCIKHKHSLSNVKKCNVESLLLNKPGVRSWWACLGLFSRGEWLSEDWSLEMNTETHRLSLRPQRSSRSLRSRRAPRAWETRSARDPRSTLWDDTDERVQTGSQTTPIPHTVLLWEDRIIAFSQNDAQMNYEEVLCSLHAGVRTTDPLAPGRPSVPGLPCRLSESTQSERLDPTAIFRFKSLLSKTPAET